MPKFRWIVKYMYKGKMGGITLGMHLFKGIYMRLMNLRNTNRANLAVLFALLLLIPVLSVKAGGNIDNNNNNNISEIIVQRVDNNSLIRLRIYIDGKVSGSLKVGDIVTIKVHNGHHTIRAAFEDYPARSTEVTQFSANNSRLMFTVTDESIVAVGEESLHQNIQMADAAALVPENNGQSINPFMIETSVRNSFDRVTKDLKKKTRIAVVNVDSDNIDEADYVLEELTYLTVHSPKKFQVIDRRQIDAFRASNSIGIPSYNNDYILMLIGQLLGADIILSARMDGPGQLRRLRVKALEVKTGQLIGDSSERI
jgi:hypothetical protein